MKRNLVRAWNARTPDYLHPYTKANAVWQLKLTALFLVLFVGKDYIEKRLENYDRTIYRPLRNTKVEL